MELTYNSILAEKINQRNTLNEEIKLLEKLVALQNNIDDRPHIMDNLNSSDNADNFDNFSPYIQNTISRLVNEAGVNYLRNIKFYIDSLSQQELQLLLHFFSLDICYTKKDSSKRNFNRVSFELDNLDDVSSLPDNKIFIIEDNNFKNIIFDKIDYFVIIDRIR